MKFIVNNIAILNQALILQSVPRLLTGEVKARVLLCAVRVFAAGVRGYFTGSLCGAREGGGLYWLGGWLVAHHS